MLQEIPKHTDSKSLQNRKWMEPIEECYWKQISKREWNKAQIIAAEIEKISKGKKSRYFCPDSGTIGKVGEFIVDHFLTEYCDYPWVPIYKIVQKTTGDVCDFTICGISIDVKTRTLKTIGGKCSLGLYTFPLMVTKEDLAKQYPIYICCGFDPNTLDGYILGWATREEVMLAEFKTDLKYPAHCLPVGQLHPIQYLLGYIGDV